MSLIEHSIYLLSRPYTRVECTLLFVKVELANFVLPLKVELGIGIFLPF